MEEPSLRSCKLYDESCVILSILLKDVPIFHTLDLSDNEKISDEGCVILLTSLKFMAPKFNDLRLQGCCGISFGMLQRVDEACERNLTISYDQKIIKEKLAGHKYAERHLPLVVAAMNPILGSHGDVLPGRPDLLFDIIRSHLQMFSCDS